MERKQIEKQLAALDVKRADLQVHLNTSVSRTLVACTGNCYGKGCGKKSQIGKLIYIATYWYIQPYSCSEGDYWQEGEGQFDCPHCGHRNRLYEQPDIQALKHRFAKVVTSHDGHNHPPKIDKDQS